MIEDIYPYSYLTTSEMTIFLVFNLVNYVIELTCGIIFCLLWSYFSSITKQQVSKRQHCLVNLTIAFLMLLFFTTCTIFEFLDPFISYLYLRDIMDGKNWEKFFANIYFVRFLVDFVSCLMILYLMHTFGPA